MAATFASPIAAVLLAVELLLFEWKPRSLVPVGLASVTATLMRYYIIGMGPIFPTAPHPAFIGVGGLLGCVVVGLVAGLFSMLLTNAVYASEDAFQHLPIHWMWWPAIGGLVIGLGGLIFPQALGVGYDTIGALLAGKATFQIILGVLIVKSIIWAVSLGSGTSGGVLAPLLMMGGALGGIEATFLPNEEAGFWALISMGAMLGGTMRSPFTGIIFALELTHDVNSLLPLLTAVLVAHGLTVLFMRRSILTEKVSRRGYHLSREYATDPLEILFVREVMRTDVVVLADTLPIADLAQSLDGTHERQSRTTQRLYPVLNNANSLVGVATRKDLQTLVKEQTNGRANRPLTEFVHSPAVAYPDEPLRVVVYRMAETGFTRLPVVERNNPQKLLGMVSLNDLLKARARNMTEERHRERVLHVRRIFRPRTKTEASRPAVPIDTEHVDVH
jgi:CBS domain-containing protein